MLLYFILHLQSTIIIGIVSSILKFQVQNDASSQFFQETCVLVRAHTFLTLHFVVVLIVPLQKRVLVCNSGHPLIHKPWKSETAGLGIYRP